MRGPRRAAGFLSLKEDFKAEARLKNFESEGSTASSASGSQMLFMHLRKPLRPRSSVMKRPKSLINLNWGTVNFSGTSISSVAETTEVIDVEGAETTEVIDVEGAETTEVEMTDVEGAEYSQSEKRRKKGAE